MGALTQLHTGIHGAGIASVLLFAAILCVTAAICSRATGPSSRWRLALIVLPILIANFGLGLELLSQGLHRSIGSTAAVPVIAKAVIGIAAFPAVLIGFTALRAARGASAPLLFILGLFLAHGLGSPAVICTIACAGLLLADTVAEPERGWHSNSRLLSSSDSVFTLVGGLLLSSAWVHFRSTFDPTTFGATAVLVGALFSRALVPGTRRPPLVGIALIGGVVWLSMGWMDSIAPRLASWGFNQTSGPIPPTLWLALPFASLGLVLGPFIRCDANRPSPWLFLAGGLWLGPSVLTESTMIWWSITIAAIGVLVANRFSHQLLSIGVLLGLLGSESVTERTGSATTQTGIWSQTNSARALALWADPPNSLQPGLTAITPSGTIATWTDGQIAPHLASTLDGLTRSNRGNLAQGEEMAGHLAALLATNQESVLILGDELGNGLRGLAAHPLRIAQISAPFPISTRFLGSVDEVRRKLWIAPAHPLFPEHPASLLHRAAPVGAVVEISHTPWADGADIRWDRQHVQDVKARLTSDGLYVLCAHLRFWPEKTAAAIGSNLVAQFKHVQVWTPPEGADSLLFVASDKEISYEALAKRFPDGRIGLESMGFTSAETIAGSALLGTSGVAAWGETATGLPPKGRLNSTIFEKPVLHVGPIAPWMEEHPNPWMGEVPTGVTEVRNARKLLIELFQKASHGQLQDAFSAARKLSADHGAIGQTAVANLIEPYLNDARKAISKARRDGQNSKHWNDALRFATTAKMLAPKHASTHSLLGELALGQGQLEQAWNHFTKALEVQPSHVPALDGLAQCARLEKDSVKAEQALRDATRHAPRDWRAWHNLAVFHLESNNTTRAMEAIQTAAGLAPADEVTPLLVLTKTLLRRGEAGAALLRAEQCTQMAPKNGLSWYLRGRAHYDLNRFNEAENDFRKAVLTDSDLIEARGGIGLVRAVVGDPTAATAAFKEVLNRDPNNSAARENLRRLQLIAPTPEQP